MKDLVILLIGVVLIINLSCRTIVNNDKRLENEELSFMAGNDSIRIFNWPIIKKSSRQNDIDSQFIRMEVIHSSDNSSSLLFKVLDGDSVRMELIKGSNNFNIPMPLVKKDKAIQFLVSVDKAFGPVEKNFILKPVSRKKIYLISHSHNDIGYSDLQTVVEKKQNSYIREAMQLIEETKALPENARYKWNIESLWALENFMESATEKEREKVINDIKQGNIGISAGYCNELTGVASPQELYHLLDYSRILKEQYGVDSKTYMISDVPGLSWPIVSIFKGRGVDFISSGTNRFTRVGLMRKTWGDKPFYWVSQDGKDSVLLWFAGKGYSYFMGSGKLKDMNSEDFFGNYMRKLDDENYPYQMV